MARLIQRVAAAAALVALLVATAGPALGGIGPRTSCCGTKCRCDRGFTVARCGCGSAPAPSTSTPVSAGDAILAEPPLAAHGETAIAAIATSTAPILDGASAPPDPPPRLDR